MCMFKRQTAAGIAIAALAGMATLGGAQPAGAPIRMTAWAVNMSNIATGANATVDIRVNRWSTAEERQRLITTFLEKGQDALLHDLQKLPVKGRIRIPGWQGRDPHN